MKGQDLRVSNYKRGFEDCFERYVARFPGQMLDRGESKPEPNPGPGLDLKSCSKSPDIQGYHV